MALRVAARRLPDDRSTRLTHTPDTDPPAVITVAEAAALLRTGPKAVRRAVQDGTIPSLRVGRHIRIPHAALMRLINDPDPTAVQFDIRDNNRGLYTSLPNGALMKAQS